MLPSIPMHEDGFMSVRVFFLKNNPCQFEFFISTAVEAFYELDAEGKAREEPEKQLDSHPRHISCSKIDRAWTGNQGGCFLGLEFPDRKKRGRC